jgi:hypothetical protein
MIDAGIRLKRGSRSLMPRVPLAFHVHRGGKVGLPLNLS